MFVCIESTLVESAADSVAKLATHLRAGPSEDAAEVDRAEALACRLASAVAVAVDGWGPAPVSEHLRRVVGGWYGLGPAHRDVMRAAPVFSGLAACLDALAIVCPTAGQ